MREPLISIITPAYNAASGIEKTILSVINQRYKAVEHVIVDGCSEDATTSIIVDYQNCGNHIRYISEKDKGVYDAINKGMDLCSGEWIYIMGAGDTFFNEHVLTELFEEGLFMDEHVIYGNVFIQSETGWTQPNSIYDGPFTLEKLLRKNICHQSIFYPKSVIKNIGYYLVKYDVTSDWDYNVHCFAKYKFTYADKIIAVFHGSGKSSENEVCSFYEDMPQKVIEYFQLDPGEICHQDRESPFYQIIARFNSMQDKNNNH